MKTSFLIIIYLSIFSFSGYQVGDEASDFKLKNTNDEISSLSKLNNNKGAIVIFTCNTCPYSVAYEDRIIDLHNKYSGKGMPVIAINPNDPSRSPGDSFSEMKKRADEKNFPFDYAFDETQEVTRIYGATNTPHVYVLEKEKDNYIVRYIGAIDNNSWEAKNADKHYVEDAVDRVLSGKDVKIKSTKAVGCSIKWG